MRDFCCFLKEEVWKNFSIRADVFVSKKKKKHVHIALKKSFSDHECFDKILKFISDEWEKRRFCLKNMNLFIQG